MASLNARILKVTGMFGGLQATNIICSVVRSKLVAIWIGATGVGLFGVLNAALEMINSLTQLGIRQSAVRDLAAASKEEVPALVCVIRRWSLVLGCIGTLLTLVCSPWLSELSFGTRDYWWGFALLSATVVLSAVNNGEGAVFQGLKSFRKLSVCSMIGAAGGLIVSIPMFYLWRIDSIVPSIMAYALMTWLAMGYYRERVPRPGPAISWSQTIAIGRRFMLLGIYMTVTAVVTNAISYAFMSYLNNVGDMETTGYYNAGFTIVNRYVGLVFTAIAMEYFPRLASATGSQKRTGVFVSNQIYIALTVIVPLSLMFITASQLAVRLFYSGDFMVIMPFIVWATLGTVFRAVSWCMAFVILARGDGRTFLWTELLSGAASIALNIVCFNAWGYAGLGYAYILWYGIYTAIVGYVYFRRYKLKIERRIPLYVAYSLLLPSAGAFIALNYTPVYALPLALAACGVSIAMLRKKLL